MTSTREKLAAVLEDDDVRVVKPSLPIILDKLESIVDETRRQTVEACIAVVAKEVIIDFGSVGMLNAPPTGGYESRSWQEIHRSRSMLAGKFRALLDKAGS